MGDEKAKMTGEGQQEIKADKPEFQQSLKIDSPKIAKSVFGEVLVKSDQEKNSPSEKPSAKGILFKAAETLSKIMTKAVEVIKDGSEKGTVKMEIDLEKIPLGPDQKRLTAKDILTPDVKKFSISVGGAKAKIVERKDVNGNIDYYYQDEEGKLTLLKLPAQGIATVKINPEDIADKSRAEILEIMKKQIRKEVKKNLGKQTKAITKALESKVEETKDTQSQVQIEEVGDSTKRSPVRSRRSRTSGYAEAVAGSVVPVETMPEATTLAPAVSSETAPVEAEYRARVEEIKQRLNPSEVSIIPETPATKEIPPKPEGTIRMVVFGDTDAKLGKNTDQLHLKELQAKCPEWEADFALGVGDYLYDLSKRDDEQYKAILDKAKGEFAGFGATPFALALGNHDRYVKGTDHMLSLYKDKLPGFEGDDTAYSFTQGEATFVVFNEGGSTISKKQTDFFRKKSKEAKGAVYLINHRPPIQDAFGPGLSPDGKSNLENFQEIQKIAKENIENNGRPFYILSGHTHFSHVIGNFLNPGGMGMNYYGLNNEKLQSARSAAVVDIDKKTGAIKNVYFRTAESGFKDPLPDTQHQLAWNKLEPTPKTAPVPAEKAVAEKIPELEPPELVSADDYVPEHSESGNSGRPFNYFQRNLTTSKGKTQISTSGRLGVTKSAKKHIVANQSLANQQAEKLKQRGVNVIISLLHHSSQANANTKKAAQSAGLEFYNGHMSTTFGQSSIRLFNQIAKYLKEGKSVHVHCRYGTHRAKTSLAGGLLAAGYAKSVGEAFEMVGLKYGSFGNQWDYFTAVTKYARSKGIKVETPQELNAQYGIKGKGLTYYQKGVEAATS